MDLLDSTDDDHDVECDEPRDDGPSLTDGLQALPVLGDDIYLRLQAFNLGLVDSLLNDWERTLIAEYHEQETTPISTAVMVGAVGQLWVFGLYELLRTWRQRGRELLAFADGLAGLDAAARQLRLDEQNIQVRNASADPSRPNPAHFAAYERVANDLGFAATLREALDRLEWPFKKLEALRVQMAKHEVPKSKGSYAMSPGYTRIDEATQSICWEVSLGDMEVEIVSRRSLADLCRRFGTDSSIVILPRRIQDALAPLPLQSYGVKRVVLVLANAAEHVAFVAWNRQILNLIGSPPIAIDPEQVIAVRAAPNDTV
jgi:hypothetical protein